MATFGEVVYLRLSAIVRDRVKAEARALGLRECDLLRLAVARGLAIGEPGELAEGQRGGENGDKSGD